MRNLYTSLGLTPDSDSAEIDRGCRELNNTDSVTTADMSAVLLNRERKSVYDAAHIQFTCFAEILAGLKENPGSQFRDTNNWDRRLVEFDDHQE